MIYTYKLWFCGAVCSFDGDGEGRAQSDWQTQEGRFGGMRRGEAKDGAENIGYSGDGDKSRGAHLFSERNWCAQFVLFIFFLLFCTTCTDIIARSFARLPALSSA